jgi:hypothetical protein
MAIVVTIDDDEITKWQGAIVPTREDWSVRHGSLAFDASYPNTGGTVGEPITAPMFGLDSLSVLVVDSFAGYQFSWDPTNGVIHAWYVDNNATGDSALIEIPNATSLAAITAARWVAIGVVNRTHEL